MKIKYIMINTTKDRKQAELVIEIFESYKQAIERFNNLLINTERNMTTIIKMLLINYEDGEIVKEFRKL